ncbi:MAG: aspartate carbamoyltransferase catalytic subunit [Acidimicrobiales bacterium]
MTAHQEALTEQRRAVIGADVAPAPADVTDGRHHLLSVSDLGAEGIEEVLRVADAFVEVSKRAIPKVPALRGRTVVTLFVEESTRTKLSFETAAKRLSADVLSFGASSSSLKKGESLRDTVETIAAMGVDAFVIRHPAAGAPAAVARWVDACVLNAGDGWHEHPTQALLDCCTIRQVFAEREGRAPAETGVQCFKGLRVAIVGDIRHSRVARSNVLALSALGAEVTLVAPGTLLPPAVETWPVVGTSHDLDAVLPRTDVCYLLRLQAERGAGRFLPSVREYAAAFGLDARRAASLADGALVMHPGPMNRGVEIADEVPDLPRSVILRQVANGVAVRMAVLFMLLGTPQGRSPTGALANLEDAWETNGA